MTEQQYKTITEGIDELKSLFGDVNVTVTEAARIKKKSRQTIQRWINKGILPASKQGGQYQIKLKDL